MLHKRLESVCKVPSPFVPRTESAHAGRIQCLSVTLNVSKSLIQHLCARDLIFQLQLRVRGSVSPTSQLRTGVNNREWMQESEYPERIGKDLTILRGDPI